MKDEDKRRTAPAISICFYRPASSGILSAMSNSHERQAEGGILIGNQLDKDQVTNPVARRMVVGFDTALETLVKAVQPKSIHEVGCGEGRLSRKLHALTGQEILASDFSRELIAENTARGDGGVRYAARSVYDLRPEEDRADLIVCCEVLEHVERPAEALTALRGLGAASYILSVPREPWWRMLNMARGKYLRALGNTPGHLNHWSQCGFVSFLERGGFRVNRRLLPLPWTMVTGKFE